MALPKPGGGVTYVPAAPESFTPTPTIADPSRWAAAPAPAPTPYVAPAPTPYVAPTPAPYIAPTPAPPANLMALPKPGGGVTYVPAAPASYNPTPTVADPSKWASPAPKTLAAAQSYSNPPASYAMPTPAPVQASNPAPSYTNVYSAQTAAQQAALDQERAQNPHQTYSANRPPGKPTCATVHFGFGGKLVCMFPQQKMAFHQQHSTPSSGLKKGPVHLFRLSSVLPPACLPPSFESTPSPLVDSDEQEVHSYLTKNAQDPSSPLASLWELILLASTSKGTLRSDAGTSDPSAPEAKICR